jgi:hypothetical protein
MLPLSFANPDWQVIVERLGGAEAIGRLARQTKAFQRPAGSPRQSICCACC